MGTISEHRDFWHVSKSSRHFETDWVKASFLQLVHDYLSQLFKETEHYFPTIKDHWSQSEWTKWTDVVSARRGITAWDRKRHRPSHVHLRQLQLSTHSKWRSRQNILTLPQKHWKASFSFQHPIFMMDGFLQWQLWSKITKNIVHCLSSPPDGNI